MADKCLFGQNGELHHIASPLIGHFLAIDPATVEPWATLLRENTPLGTPIGVPIFVAQGLADTLVRPQTTTDYVAQLCATGEDVHYVR